MLDSDTLLKLLCCVGIMQQMTLGDPTVAGCKSQKHKSHCVQESTKQEEQVGMPANVPLSDFTSIAMVEMEESNKKVDTDTTGNNDECLHMMSFPLSPVDLSKQRTFSETDTQSQRDLTGIGMSSDPDQPKQQILPEKDRTLAGGKCLADATCETTSDWTDASGITPDKSDEGRITKKEIISSSLKAQPTKTTQSFVFPETTGILDPEHKTEPVMSVRSIDSEASFKMSTKFKSETKEVKGLTMEKPMPTPQQSVSTLKNSSEFKVSMTSEQGEVSDIDVHSTDILDATNGVLQKQSVKDSITIPEVAPQNLTTVTMETGTGSTSDDKEKSQEKNAEIRVTRRPTKPRKTS
ncbi:uncharacterized protein LOC127620689 [Xyrauchen texanus]|uniref:uncharacterized protein LOC127620689 n=1 Tax=Xyrauchen texanus TaxID=154827 RepID=UPI00224203FE|nr:uncharacterized protein LOC127620689 [Xyrauchen texanus]